MDLYFQILAENVALTLKALKFDIVDNCWAMYFHGHRSLQFYQKCQVSKSLELINSKVIYTVTLLEAYIYIYFDIKIQRFSDFVQFYATTKYMNKNAWEKHVIYMISPLNNVLCKRDKWITKSHTHSIFPEAYNCLHLN